MMNTFLLNNSVSWKHSLETIINSIGYVNSDDLLINLKNAILFSKKNNEDVIFCSICDDYLLKMDYEKLQSIIDKIATESIYLLYVDYICEETFLVDDYLCAINGNKKVPLFL